MALAALLAAAAGQLPAQGLEDPELTPKDWILFGVGWGGAAPFTRGFPLGRGVEGIRTGPLVDDLIQEISLHRELEERFRVDIDHLSSRLGDAELFGGANTYALSYLGSEGEVLQRVDVGNLSRSIPGSWFVPIDGGTGDSFALHAAAAAGPVRLEALARYGASLEGRRRFRGTRELVEVDLLEVDYARARFFLLPDRQVDAGSLQVARSSSTGTLSIDGRPFALLQAGVDYTFDNAAGQVRLAKPLTALEDLCVSYTKGGPLVPVGDATLGANAIVDGATGFRGAFTRVAYPEYFPASAGEHWLFLRKQGLNSYWEMRSAFLLDDLGEGRVPEQMSVEILRTATLAPNENYAALEGSYLVEQDAGAVFFTFTAEGAIHPRPFPGDMPFVPGTTGSASPYDPANLVYGSVSYPPPSASSTTIRLRYLLASDVFSLGPGVVEGSVRVTVDGTLLPPSSYTVDAQAGTISFSPGTIGPESDVEVGFRVAPLAGTGRDFLAGLRADIGGERLGASNLLTLQVPIPDGPAPRMGEERGGRVADSLEASAALGAAPEAEGFSLQFRAAGALGVAVANPAGVAVVADMEDDARTSIGLGEDAWTLASKSALLPVALVPLQNRGEVRYENYWQEQALGGAVLRDLAWDNSANPQFAYSGKAGPYAAAEESTGGSEQSLVVDTAFGAAEADAYATVSTIIPALDLSGADRLLLALRGDGVTGDTLRVYVEALSRYDEDINGNAALDGETQASDAGYALSFLDGDPTRVGTNRRGETNARLDSEDRNANGVLDTLAEQGVVLAADGGPDTHVASLVPGDNGWKQISIPIAALVSANPAVFQDVRALRITVKPATATPAASVSGRVVVNSIQFASSTMKKTAGLSIGEVSAQEDPVMRDHPFSGSFPELYQDLHGSASWRADNGHVEKSLAVSVTADIPASAAESVTLPFVPLADFRSYKAFRSYVYLEPGWTLPPDARFDLGINGAGTEKYSVSLDPADFASGWNEVSVLLEPPWTVTVRGAAAGSLSASGGATQGLLGRTASVSFTIRAGAANPVPEGFRLWLDEWHLAEARVRLDAAFLAEAKAGWKGVLLSAGGFPLLSDAAASAAVEHRQGDFLGTADRTRDEVRGSAGAVLAKYLSMSVSAAAARERATTVEQAVPEALRDDAFGRYAAKLTLDLDIPWVPVLEHRWERSIAETRDPSVTATEQIVLGTGSGREALTLSEKIGGPEGLRQSWLFTRSWSADSRERWKMSDGSLLDSTLASVLSDSHEAEIAFRQKWGELGAGFARQAAWSSDSAPPPPEVPASWFQRFGLILAQPELALPGARKQSLQDRFRLSASVPRTELLGVSASALIEYGELNVDSATGARDVTRRDAFSLGLPLSPDRAGALVLTPELALSFAGSFRQASAALGEGELLLAPYPALLLVPLAWLDPDGWGRAEQHAAADTLGGTAGVQSAANTVTAASSLSLQLARAPWYLPARAKAALRDETGRQGDARTQKRSLTFSLGKDGTLRPGLLSVDAEAGYARDYALKVRSLSLSERSSLSLAGRGSGGLQLDHSLSWTRERQALGDPALSLYPGTPDGAVPVAAKPDTDTVRSSLSAVYTWKRPAGLSRRMVEHTERLSLEDSYTWTTGAATVSSIPVRGTFHHSSDIEVSRFFTLGIWGKAAAGLETTTGAAGRLEYPSVGFELGVNARFRF